LPSVLAVKNLRRIKTFSPQSRKDRKGRKETHAYCFLVFKSILTAKTLRPQRKKRNPGLLTASLRLSGKDSWLWFCRFLGAQFTITFFCLAKNPNSKPLSQRL
jgi:hypothetical protein